MIRVLAVLISLVLCSVLIAQPVRTAKVSVPGAKGFSFWISATNSEAMPEASTPFEFATAEVALPDDLNGKSLFVLNDATNRVSKLSLIELAKKGEAKLASADFKIVYKLSIQLIPEEGVVPSGIIRLKGEKFEREELVSSQDNNLVTIYLVSEPNFSVTVTYDAGPGKAMTEPVQVKSEAKAGGDLVEIPIPTKFEAIATTTALAGETPNSASQSSTKSEEPSKANPFGTMFRLLFGLLIVGGLGYLGYWYYKNNSKVVDNMIQQAGLKPPPGDPTGTMQPDPEPRTIQKITLPDADPIAPVATPTTSSIKNPRLVTTSGDVHMLPSGTHTVGRENAGVLAIDESVSRAHAVLTQADQVVTLADSGSTNGTFVNGVKLTGPVVLKPGDTVQFGALQYRYEE